MADNSLPDYYNELNIDPQATTIEIKSAYRALAKQLHPDKTGSNDTSAFRRAHEAYEKLTDLSYRAEYDQAYRRARRRYRETENYAGPSRTAAYEAEEREEEERRLRRKSPPPYKPVRKSGEPGHSYFLGKAYQAWEKKDAAYKAKHPKWHAEQAEKEAAARQTAYMATSTEAHGVHVQMSTHPCCKQRCTMRTDQWSSQLGGIDFCVFCVKGEKGCSRCPGCQALACKACLAEVVKLERGPFQFGSGSRKPYMPSGG